MIEARATIDNIRETRRKIESLGAVFAGEYTFKDIIFIPKEGEYNLDDDYLRVRVITKNNRPTRQVALVRKRTEFKEMSKKSKTVLQKWFDTEKEAVEFVGAQFGNEFKRGFEYERTGWQYNLGASQIFVEEIGEFQPSVEIETGTEKELADLFIKIGIIEKIHLSVPEIMRRILD